MTHEDLKNIRRKRQHVINLQERIDRLRAAAAYPARQMNELSNISSDVRDKLADNIAQIIDLERELALDVLSLERDITAVDRALSELPENQEKVLRLRYCEGLKWRLVANKAGYSVSHCRNINTAFVKESTQKYI